MLGPHQYSTDVMLPEDYRLTMSRLRPWPFQTGRLTALQLYGCILADQSINHVNLPPLRKFQAILQGFKGSLLVKPLGYGRLFPGGFPMGGGESPSDSHDIPIQVHPWDDCIFTYIQIHRNQPTNVGTYTVRPMDGMEENYTQLWVKYSQVISLQKVSCINLA